MGRRLIVVGGAGAVGQAFVAAAEAKGDLVAVIDLPASLKAAGIEGRPLAIPIDVTSKASVEAAIATLAGQWTSADALVYLSGYALSPPRLAHEVSDEEWAGILNVNLSGAFRVSMAARSLLAAGTLPAIVFVSSSMAFGPVKGFAPYIASKAGMIGLARSLALELAPAIRVNVIAPSAMETPFLAGGTGRVADDARADWFSAEAQAAIAGIPLGRLATPDDCIGALDYLVGEQSAFMTGQVLVINGGRQMR